ncbi:hypothetical protein Shyhy02_70230 [Streptomyces hygroscopicus subsp. hygroscopicus]|nr:hypothetical protein Shyhy02_70230 [Streptomyces hygroscopicus subsp. hygroscopicus]
MRPPVCGPVGPGGAMNPYTGPVTGPGVASGGNLRGTRGPWGRWTLLHATHYFRVLPDLTPNG